MRSDTQRDHGARVARALETIHADLDRDLRTEVLARLVCSAAHHFHRMFRARVGEPPKAYVKRLRLERAAAELVSTPAPVGEVAERAGYRAHEAFTRAFRGVFGWAPSTLRGSLREGTPLGGVPWRVRRLRGRRIAYVSCVGHYEGVHRELRALERWAAARGVSGTPLGVYADDQIATSPESTRFEAALLVDGEVPAGPRVRTRELPDRDYAVLQVPISWPMTRVRLLYHDAYQRLLPEAGCRPMLEAPPFEVYSRGLREVHLPLV